ncbi:MAG: ester cyclase [Halobacteriota archaeon]
MSTAPSENKQLTRRVPEEMATQHNLSAADEVFAEDFVEHGGPEGDIRGRKENMERFEHLLEAFPDFEAVVEDIVAEGDTVAMRVTLSGTHEGRFMGFEPTGNSFEVQNMVFTRIEDGKIVERWMQADTLGMLQQLGIVEL